MKKRTLLLTTLAVFTITFAGCGSATPNSTTKIPNNTSGNQMEASSPTENNGASQTDSKNIISEDEAKAIALSDAGVTEDKLTNIRITQDSDDGVSVYDVELYIGNKEYDYEIDASNGNIRSQDTDIEDDFHNNSSDSSSSVISLEEASKIVLAKVEGATEKHLRIALDTDDGQQIYEGEIHYNGMEYEFELNAKTGNILEWSKEREDD